MRANYTRTENKYYYFVSLFGGPVVDLLFRYTKSVNNNNLQVKGNTRDAVRNGSRRGFQQPRRNANGLDHYNDRRYLYYYNIFIK